MKNSKFKVKPLFVLAVTALILLVTAISSVTFAWIETGNNLVIKTADASNNAANVSVVNRAGYARNMAKNKLDSVINLNEYVDYRNLYFAPATGKMVKANGDDAQTASEATDVKVSINGANNETRDVLPEDISTNYIDFEIKVKNNENTHSDIKFANSDTERVLLIDGVDVSKAKFGVAVIATNTNGDKKVIFTDSEKLLKETPSFGTLYPHEEITLRVKIWLDSDYSKFIDNNTVIAGKPVTLNLSLVMTGPKTTTFKFADKTTDFDDRALLKLGQPDGYKLFAVNGGNTDERYQLTAKSTDPDGVTTLSGMPEFLLYGSCAEKHNPPFKDEFQLWAYEDGDLTKDPKVWIPGFKPTVSGNQTALDAYTDTYTIYGDLALRIDPNKAETHLRGTWQKVVEVELRDQSIEKIFTDESIRMVTLYNGIISYPMYRNRVQNSTTGEMEPTNALTSYMPGYIFTMNNIDQIYFNSRVTDECEGTHNLWGTVRANNSYTQGKVEGQDKYVFTVFGFTGSGTDNEDYCFGEWYSGEVDKITLRDVTTGRRIQTYYQDRYINNDPKQLRVSYKGNCNGSGDGLGESFYLAHFDKDAKCWYTTLPRDINPHAGNLDDKLVQFRVNANNNSDKDFKACDRVQTNGEYVYYFINELKEPPLGSWDYNLADDTVIYMKYHESNTSLGHTSLFVEQTVVVPGDSNVNWMPLGDWNTENNTKYGIIEGDYKVFYINKYDFNLGQENPPVLYGEQFKMKPHTGGTSAFTANTGITDNDGNIIKTTDGKPLYVGGRYRIDADGKVTELASFGYIRSEQIVIADVNEICSLQGAVDFQDPGTNITYSLELNVTEGTGATSANVTKLSISTDAADYGRLTFQANKAGEYKVKVIAKANEGTTEKTSEKTFIFKVGLNPRITIADNVNVEAVTFNYTDENGNKRKLVKGSSAKIMKGTVLTADDATMNKYSYLRFDNGYTATFADGTNKDIEKIDNKYTYTVGNQAAVIDVKVKNSDNPYIICGENKWDTLTSWDSSIEMTYDSDRNTVFADIKKIAEGDAKIKIVRDGNVDGHKENGDYCVNYGKPPVKVSVPGVTAYIDTNDWHNLVIRGVANGDSIRVEYDITDHIIYIKRTLASIDVKLFAVPEFDKAQLSVTAKGQDAALIKAAKNDGTGTAYEGTTVTMEQIVSNADFNRYSVKYFTVEFKNSGGVTVGDIQTVHPGDKFTMPAKTEDPQTNVVLVEITTHINKDNTPFYVAGSADNIKWQLPTEAMTVTDNTVTGYVTVDNIGENGECFIRIAKGSAEENAFKQINTSVTMSKAGRPNVYVESDSYFPATHEQQSIKIKKQGIVKQTLKVTYDLGDHRMTVSAPLYFQSTLEKMSVTTGVKTDIVIGALLPNSTGATYSTVCGDTDATIGEENTAIPTFTSSNNQKDYKVVTTADVTIDGKKCYASKTFNVDVNDLVDVTIKKHSKFAISGVTVKATHTPTEGEQSEYKPSASDVTFRAAVGDTVTLTLDIPNDKFNGFYADKDNNFTITDGNGTTVTPTFTKSTTGDYTVATFKVPAGGATVTPTPAQHNSMTYYLTGDSNAVDGVSWADTDGYNKTFTYDKNTNTITYPNAVLKGNKIANIKISRDGYKANPAAPGRDDPNSSISYEPNMKFDWTGAPLSVSKVSVTSDTFSDIRIEGAFNANNPKKVNLKYYLAEHKLVITDSEDTGTIMTEDLLAVLRNQKVMFYFGIKDELAGYLNEADKKGQNHYSFLNSMTYETVSYNYAPVCMPSKMYYIAQNTSWSGKSIEENAQAGKAYLLNMISHDNNVVTKVNSASGCTVPKKSFSVNLNEQTSIDTGVTLNSSTSATGAANSLTYYITETPTEGEPTINGNTTFKPFDPSNLKQLSKGNYIVVPVVSDGSILVRGEDIKLTISDKTIVNVDVTVENNAHAKVTAKSGTTTINEGETQTLQAGDEVTITAPIENATFNSYTRVQSFDIINAETNVVIKTVPATNNSATFTVPDVKKADGTKGEVIIRAKLVQSDTLKYYITGENIDGIEYWTSTDSDNMLFAFDKDKNLFTKEIKLTGNTVQFKIAKNSSSLRDDPRYSISEADPRPTFTSSVEGLKSDYATSEFDGKTVYNFQLTGDAISGTTVNLTYNPSANTLTVSAPSTAKPKRTVTINPVEHAVVTATYIDASGNTVTIKEGAEGAQVYEGTELTLNCAILNPDFNSYNFAKYDVTGAALSGSELTVGAENITVTTNLSRDTTSDKSKFYLTGTALKADATTLSWGDTYKQMPYVAGTNTVAIPIVLDANNTDTPKIKISKGGYTNDNNNYRDNPDYSVTLAKDGREDVKITNNAIDVVTANLDTSGDAKDRCLVFSYATGVTGNLNLKLTYDLDKHEIIIDKVAAPTNVTVTLKPHRDYSKSGITFKAVYTGGTLEVVNNENNFTTISGDVLTLSATIPNASFNSYTLNKFVVSDGTNTTDVTKVDGKYTYTIPDNGVTALTITADITQADPALKLAHRAGTSGTWSVEALAFDSETNTATGTFNVTTESDKYFTISNTNASTVITLSSTNVTDNSTYAAYESTGKSVKVTLPAGLTQQSLKFTYDLKTNVVTVDAPVKFNDLSDNAITTKKNTEVTLKSTATKLSDLTGEISYNTVCTSSNNANVTIGSETPATPTFSASADGKYTVTTTATVDSYVAVKTYTITVDPATAPIVGTKVTDADIISLLKGEKIMFYYGDTWNSGTKYLKFNSDTVTSASSKSYYVSSINNTYNYAVACVASEKYYYSNSSGWGGDSFPNDAVAGKAYIDGIDQNNVKEYSANVSLTSANSSVTLAQGKTSNLGVTATTTTSLIGGTNTIEYYYKSGEDFYKFDPTNSEVTAQMLGKYTVYPVVTDGSIRVLGDAITLTVTAGIVSTTSSVTFNNTTGYDLKVKEGTNAEQTVAANNNTSLDLTKNTEVTVTVNVPNAKFNSKSATFSGVTATSTGTNTMTFIVPQSDATVTVGIAQPETYAFSLCGEGAKEFTSWDTAVGMTYNKTANTVTGTINVDSSGTAKIKIVKGGNVGSSYRDVAAHSVTVEENAMSLANIHTTVGDVAFDGTGKDRNIKLTNASSKTVTVTYDLENNTVSIAEVSSSGGGTTVTGAKNGKFAKDTTVYFDFSEVNPKEANILIDNYNPVGNGAYYNETQLAEAFISGTKIVPVVLKAELDINSYEDRLYNYKDSSGSWDGHNQNNNKSNVPADGYNCVEVQSNGDYVWKKYTPTT